MANKGDNGAGEGLKQLHCSMEGCDKFLGYTWIDNGLLSIKCHKCKTVNLTIELTETMEKPSVVQEVRCQKCNRFLYSAGLASGIIRVKCRGCGSWNELRASTEGTEITTKARLWTVDLPD